MSQTRKARHRGRPFTFRVFLEVEFSVTSVCAEGAGESKLFSASYRKMSSQTVLVFECFAALMTLGQCWLNLWSYDTEKIGTKYSRQK